MLATWDKQFPGRLESIFTALQNIAPSQLADSKLFDFTGLELNQQSTETRPISFNAGLSILAQ